MLKIIFIFYIKCCLKHFFAYKVSYKVIYELKSITNKVSNNIIFIEKYELISLLKTLLYNITSYIYNEKSNKCLKYNN